MTPRPGGARTSPRGHGVRICLDEHVQEITDFPGRASLRKSECSNRLRRSPVSRRPSGLRVPPSVVLRLEAEGHDVTTAVEMAGKGATDRELLRLCAQERRVLLTNDSDFDRIHDSGMNHEGVLRYSVNQPSREGWSRIVRGVGLIEEYLEMRNRLQWPGDWAELGAD